jgi:hypothetical protein
VEADLAMETLVFKDSEPVAILPAGYARVAEQAAANLGTPT